MRIPSFIGGTDEQRSNNLSDNQLINLYPTTNNDGSIAAFYKVDGLKSEGTLSGVPTGAYKASNGRAFYTSGTTLYELTVPAGVYTSTPRGTITTATNYEFSDNGVEMIMVNGVDGWLFTFSTNVLAKITVLTGNFTVQAATSSDVDATLTKTSHGLIVGDIVLLTTTGSLPVNLYPNTPYYVLADGFTANSFKVGLTLTGAACTISNASPCTITSASHGFFVGDKVRFLTTGALPSPLVVGTVYYVIAAGLTLDTFRISLTLGGSAINTTTTGSGVHSFNPAITIVQPATGVCSISSTSAVGGTCTISFASPAVITKVTHGLVGGEIIYILDNPVPGGGTNLPGGIIAGSPYYVLASGLTANTFKISLTDGGTAINTSSAGVDPQTYVVVPAGYITTATNNSLNVGDSVLFATTGSLPTGLTINTEYFVTGYQNITFDLGYYAAPYFNSATGKWYFWSGIRFYSTDTILIAKLGQKIKFKTNGILPTILDEDVEYNLIGTGYANYYMLSVDDIIVGSSDYQHDNTTIPVTTGVGSGLHTYIFANNFSLVTTLPEIYGTRVVISGSQSGIHSYFQEGSVAFGNHSFTTGGAAFPNGTKTISYMNGRFIACEPNTQNFYVSEVLNGRTWDAINVQTVDSNPDYVIGQIVAHNELFVFCENSGETYYDSGTTPTPFVRNLTGIFEVGCKAPYTIREIGGAVIFLGNTISGNGIVYRMAGLTPVRISTYSIEYQIQQMSDISDARAFTYQKDGHHFYVLTFPTGNKTFVFDASTSLWHERQGATYVPSATPPSVSWTPQISGITNLSVTGIAHNGTVFCAVGITSSGTASTSCWTSSDGINWTSRTIPSGLWQDVEWNGTVFCAVGGTAASPTTVSATSPDGITWTSRTMPASRYWIGISWNGTVFCAISYNSTSCATSSDGITWTARTLPSVQNWNNITHKGSLFCAISSYTSVDYVAATSNDGITWTARTLPAATSWISIASNGNIFCAIAYGSASCATSSDGVVWTAHALPENTTWRDITAIGTVFCIVNQSNNNTYLSEDGITWTLYSISGATGVFFRNGNNGTNFLTIGNASPAITALSSSVVVTAGTYTYSYWPANKYIYFNNEHLTTDTTTAIFSIDSAIYENGGKPLRIVRSFRAPPSDMKRVAHHTIQVDCEVGIGTGTEPVIALRWSDDAGNTWSTAIERGLGLVGDHAKTIIFRRLGRTKGIPRIYELSCDENVKITLLDCYLE